MGAARAYTSYSGSAAERLPERDHGRRPDINVVPGGKTRTQDKPLSDAALFAVRLAAVVIVFVTLLALARVALSAATIEATAAGDELSSQIEEARSEGTTLEVSASVLSSSSRLKQEATSLGMVEATETEVITLEADVVACDDEGNLSLSLSIAQAAADAE